MTVEQFKAALKAEPFRPFILKTGSGAIYAVNHPEMVALTPGGRTVLVQDGDHAFAILDLLLVEAIEVGYPAQTKADPKRN